MPTTLNAIEVPLPEGVHPSIEDLEALSGLCGALVAMRFDDRRHGARLRRALEHAGWEVTSGLQWHVEVRRGRELEQACGHTLEEALATVWQVVGPGETVEGTP